MKVRAAFSIMILFFIIIFLIGMSHKEQSTKINLFEYGEDLHDELIKKSLYRTADKTDFSTCTIKQPEEQSIILRMDDIDGWNRFEVSKQLVEDILNKNLKISLGVIPINLNKDKRLVNWLKNIKNDNVDILLHGYEHTPDEFKELSFEENDRKIKLGKEILMNTLGVNPSGFIPPYNEYSDETIKALKENSFLVLSAKENEMFFEKKFASTGFTTRTYDFYNNRVVPNDEIISLCQTSLEENNLCVIMMHPEDFSIPETDSLDETRYAEFTELLNELENLNAKFITFKDLMVCE